VLRRVTLGREQQGARPRDLDSGDFDNRPRHPQRNDRHRSFSPDGDCVVRSSCSRASSDARQRLVRRSGCPARRSMALAAWVGRQRCVQSPIERRPAKSSQRARRSASRPGRAIWPVRSGTGA